MADRIERAVDKMIDLFIDSYTEATSDRKKRMEEFVDSEVDAFSVLIAKDFGLTEAETEAAIEEAISGVEAWLEQ